MAERDRAQDVNIAQKWWVRFSDWLIPLMTAVIAAGLLLLFAWVVIRTVGGVDNPPLLADPAPTAVPTPGDEGQLPPQLRGAYDPNARGLALLAVVGPLVTTVVGFYFGQRAGAAAGAAATHAAETKADTTQKATTAVLQAAPQASGGDLLTTLRNNRLL